MTDTAVMLHWIGEDRSLLSLYGDGRLMYRHSILSPWRVIYDSVTVEQAEGYAKMFRYKRVDNSSLINVSEEYE